MWAKEYRDTPEDSPLQKQKLEVGKGLTGCDMHEIYGWGETYTPPSYKKTFLRRLVEALFTKK